MRVLVKWRCRIKSAVTPLLIYMQTYAFLLASIDHICRDALLPALHFSLMIHHMHPCRYVSIALVVILLIRMGLAFHYKKCCFESWDHKVHWSEVLGFVITGITIFVVAVPEGLPLAVTIALAFSVKKMLKDQNLVRHLSACETMGGATTICSDKTGTLTTSRMTVVNLWSGGTTFKNNIVEAKHLPHVKELATSCVVNTLFKTYLKPSPSGLPVYCGNDTECALLLLANQLGHPYDGIRSHYRDDQTGRKCFSFSSDRKCMTTIVLQGGKFIAYTKGAAEIVSKKCTSYIGESGEAVPCDPMVRFVIYCKDSYR